MQPNPSGGTRVAASATRVAVGAATAIFDTGGAVLLVRHSYGRLNWELPGGGSEAGDHGAPDP